VVRTAYRLFGDDTTYLAINVGIGPYSQMGWAHAWPMGELTQLTPIGDALHNIITPMSS